MNLLKIILLCPLLLNSPLKADDKEEGFSQLFNDKDLSGWTKLRGNASFEVNSGCQIRSNSSQDYKNDVVHGYQCEIESQTGTAGFIYDELRRSWLSVDRSGDSIKTWGNGKKGGLKPHLGIQDHGVPFRIRDFKITELK